MKARVIASWLVDTEDYLLVPSTGDGARALAQAQISGDADFPDSVQTVVFEASGGDLDGEPHDILTVERLVSVAQMYYQLPALIGR